MSRNRSWWTWGGLVATGALTLVLSGCGGGGSAPAAGGGVGSGTMTELRIQVTDVAIASAPVVRFTVSDQTGAPVKSMAAEDLRFNIAKLIPNVNGSVPAWQNYINRANAGAVQGSQERVRAGYPFGTFVNHGDGSYTYTFATDITSATANPCPAPCTDANGKPLDVSFAPALTHRVTIQQGNSALPRATGVFDFVPSGGVPVLREVVATATCNECHSELAAHGTRVDVKLCVTCHNRGSWVAGAAGVPNTTVDFKVMVHRIHYNNAGLALPSVIAGTPYLIGGNDFSKVVFPQDVRNCVRCHDGAKSATPQGDNWKTQPSIAACGSCHDNVYFGTAPDGAKPYQTIAHTGGVQGDDSRCALCHAAGRYTGPQDIPTAHNFPARMKAAAARFQFNILSATPSTTGSFPVVTFSVTDPSNGNLPWDIKAAQPFTAPGAALSIKFGWSNSDFGNNASGVNFGQPATVNALTTSVAGAVAGTYTVTSPVAVPAMPAGQAASLRVIMDGRTYGDVTTTGTFTDRLAVKSVFRDVAISGALVARRTSVDIAKCNVCHDTLSLHGGNRTNEPGVCAVCHNPNATDANRRPATAGVLTGGTDGKLEESIDFRTMIHAIHAGEAGKGGIREKGVTLYGFNGPVDFSGVVFPGRISDCALCHTATGYQLGGQWVTPWASGLFGTTSRTNALKADASDDTKTSATSAVCASCHDGAGVRPHMASSGGVFDAAAATANAQIETCSVCHGVGRVYDVKTVHGVK